MEVTGNSCTVYGRVVKFILHQSRAIALIRIMHPHNLNICKETSKPTRPFLRKLAVDCELARFYLTVEELDELIAVDCASIRRKCIFTANAKELSLVPRRCVDFGLWPRPG